MTGALVPQGVRGELEAVVAAHEARMPASLGGGERRRPRGRHLAVRLAAAGECVVDVPPKLSARVRVLSSFAGNARKNDGLDALATALAASRNERLAAVDPEVGSEALRLLSERREDLVAERTRALKAASTGFCETPPRRGSRDALSPPSRGHLARHTAPEHLGPPQTAIGFGGAALRIRTLASMRCEIGRSCRISMPKNTHRSGATMIVDRY